jgi:GT2 family glycosyltransferase
MNVHSRQQRLHQSAASCTNLRESASSVDLSIVIVNWNSKDFLRKCLASVFNETHGLRFEVIVIDSASFDGCDVMLREEYPQVNFIQSEKNLGFAKANNVAFLASRGKAVLFLNPDTEFTGPTINVLLKYLWKLPDAGAVGCKLLNSDGTIQTSCIQSIPTILNQVLDSEASRAKWPRSPLWGMAPLHAGSEKPAEVEAISGACAMLKRDVFEDVGLFSENYFMYAEDIDLCDKVRKNGYRNYYVPLATVIHYGGSSTQQAVSNFSVIMMREAIWRFMRKTKGELYGFGYRAAMFTSACGRIPLLFLLAFNESRSFRSDARGGAFRKWWAILRWSLNREKWVKEYYPS